MNWVFETYSNIYRSVTNTRHGVPAEDAEQRRADEQRARWQGFISRRN